MSTLWFFTNRRFDITILGYKGDEEMVNESLDFIAFFSGYIAAIGVIAIYNIWRLRKKWKK